MGWESHSTKQRNGVLELWSYGETNAMDDSDDKPLNATRVNTLREAVQLSLKDGLTENCLFVFARALLAFEATTGIKLQPQDTNSAFTLWWSMAAPLLQADADFEE